MKGRSHVLVTGAAYAALAAHPISTPLGTLAAPALVRLGDPFLEGLLGSLAVAFVGILPDVDRSGSKAARLGGWPTRLFAWSVQLVLGHRGALHSLTALLVASWAVAMLGLPDAAAVIAFGWVAHLLLDAVTRAGVPLLWPLPFALKLPPGIRTGGLGEHLFLLALLGGCAWWGLGRQDDVAARSVLERLGQVSQLDRLALGQIGDRAGELQHAVVAARR